MDLGTNRRPAPPELLRNGKGRGPHEAGAPRVSNELFTIERGAKKVLAQLPKGGLDGLARLPDGRWAVSSWEARAVFAGPVSGPFTEMATGLDSPADIGVDAGRERLLVPKFTANEVVIQPIAR